MDINFRKMTNNEFGTRRRNKINSFKINEQITERHLQETIIRLINEYIKRGYTEEQLSQMTFYRYRE